MEKIIKQPALFPLSIIIWLIVWGCEDEFGEQHNENNNYSHMAGLFIVNEGNYGSGNGSVSFLNTQTNKMENELFYTANSRPLGDIPFDIQFIDGRAIISVNNAGKVEIVNLEDFSSLHTISGLSSPRFIEVINPSTAYVSDLESSKITILNPSAPYSPASMETGKSTEAMAFDGTYLYATNWSEFYVQEPNNSLMVIDPFSQTLVKTITVTKEPNSIVIDKNNHLWVLSSGGYMNDTYPALHKIDPLSLQVLQTLEFETKNMAPSNLVMNASKDSLFFLNSHIYTMSVADISLPKKPLIKSKGRNINSLAIDPEHNDLYFSNALDFQQKGWIIRCKGTGNKLSDSARAGIGPGNMRFYYP
ncbi:MAG: hypothetical protein R6U19_06835 [Bacteroidales bacterium]